MSKQFYQNHVRYYPPHHFVLLPLLLAGFITSIIFAIKHDQTALEWSVIAFLFCCCFFGFVMMRQHYGLVLQDRIVRLEMRFRYHTLTGQLLQEDQLSLQQILALRFASDEELPELLQRAINEKLSPDDIKKAVKNWQGDYMRL